MTFFIAQVVKFIKNPPFFKWEYFIRFERNIITYFHDLIEPNHDIVLMD